MSGGDGGLLEEEHEEHENHEAWVIPYADMLTLLMALFMMLFAISSVDLAKFEKLADSLNHEFGGGGGVGVLEPEITVLEGSPAAPPGGQGAAVAAPELPQPATPPSIDTSPRSVRAEEALAREEQRALDVAQDQQQLAGIEQRIVQHADAAGIADSIRYRREARGLIVTIVTDQIMFQPGQADVQPAGAALLAEVAAALRDVPNQVTIEGHTDNVPISTARFRSNWELSTARATEVLRYLVELGLPAERLSASGYGEQRPLASNDQPDGRALNRRVELVVRSLDSPAS